jgi:hypothetical protein
MTAARFPAGLVFREFRRGSGLLESLMVRTGDERFLILPHIEGISPTGWRVYSVMDGDLMCDDNDEVLNFESLYDAKGALIKIYSESHH